MHICHQCGKTFNEPRRNQERVFCSRDCFFIAETGVQRPSMRNKPSWNEGLTSATSEKIATAADKRKKNVVDKETLRTLYIEQNLSTNKIAEMYGVTKKVIQRLCNEFDLDKTRNLLNKEILQDLYEVQGLATHEIAIRYQCTPSHIVKQLHHYGIVVRQHRNKANSIVSAEQLENMYVRRHMTYYEIGDHFGVDFTTIPYWLKKFKIPRRSVWESRKPKDYQFPDIEPLIHLYQSEGLGGATIGKMFGISRTFLFRKFKELGIPLRNSGYPNVSHYTAKDGHRVKSGLEVKVDDWLYEHAIEHVYEPSIPKSNYFADFKVGNTYIEIWGIEGNQTYEAKRRAKLLVYDINHLNLLSVYPSDFPKLTVLEKLL